jgi:ABC-type uncharacterized transport system substrate-binding protein
MAKIGLKMVTQSVLKWRFFKTRSATVLRGARAVKASQIQDVFRNVFEICCGGGIFKRAINVQGAHVKTRWSQNFGSDTIKG